MQNKHLKNSKMDLIIIFYLDSNPIQKYAIKTIKTLIKKNIPAEFVLTIIHFKALGNLKTKKMKLA